MNPSRNSGLLTSKVSCKKFLHSYFNTNAVGSTELAWNTVAIEENSIAKQFLATHCAPGVDNGDIVFAPPEILVVSCLKSKEHFFIVLSPLRHKSSRRHWRTLSDLFVHNFQGFPDVVLQHYNLWTTSSRFRPKSAHWYTSAERFSFAIFIASSSYTFLRFTNENFIRS